MTDLAWIWLYTITTVITTSIVFVFLAVWSAGGAAPWSIVPGLVRGRPGRQPSEHSLPPIRWDRGWTGDAGRTQNPERRSRTTEGLAPTGPGPRAAERYQLTAEIEDLATRRL